MEFGKENIAVAHQLWDCFTERRWDDARKLLSDDFEALWSQSREKMGPDGFIEVNRNYPGTHKIQVLNWNHEYDKFEHRSNVITQVQIQSEMPDWKKIELYAVSFFEIEEQKILSLVEYWAETYAAPDWRKKWVERY